MRVPRALVYSRSTAGHRQIYCNVLGRYLLDRGFQVVFAVGRPCELPREQMERVLPLIECFGSDIRVQIEYFLDASVSDGKVELKQIRHLNAKHHIDLSIFVDGDVLRRDVLEYPDIKGEIAIDCESLMIFLRLESLDPVYVTDHHRRLIVLLLIKLVKCARDFWFFRHVLPKYIPKSQFFVLDPRFGRLFFRSSRLYWLPDIYAPFDFDPKAHVSQDDILERLQTFLQKNKKKRTVLYFGANQPRRGYEWLLRLVHENPNLIFLHSGRLAALEGMTQEALNVRDDLLREGRMFETKVFITDNRLINSAFESCDYVLLPYSQHYGSSGIMIQAARYGKPVVVPRGGLMAYWVGKYGFGLTYEPESYEDFVCQVHLMESQWPCYTPFTLEFSRLFSRESVYHVFDNAFRRIGYIDDDCTQE